MKTRVAFLRHTKRRPERCRKNSIDISSLLFLVIINPLFIDIGIDAANLEAVQHAADAQIRALQTGGFTDDMMQKAVLRYGFQAAAASDTISDLAVQQILQLRRGDPRSGAEIAKAMQKVTRAEIAEAAKQLRADAVFVLRAEQEEAEPDAF